MSSLPENIREKRVLIVDDQMAIRAVLNAILLSAGIQHIGQAKDGMLGWEMLQSETYDLVFCDWEMPNMNGMELFEKVKEAGTLELSRFVMVTSQGTQDRVREAISSGVTQYVVKPFDENIIHKKLASIFTA